MRKHIDFSKNVKIIISVAIWLIVWQAASVLTGLDLILASPVSVLFCLGRLMTVGSTYQIIGRTAYHIISGFLCGFVLGCAFAVLASKSGAVRALLAPPVMLMKSLPMASFIILLIIWFGSGKVSGFTSFIVTFPLVYSGVMSGINKRDTQMLELSRVYGIGIWRRVRWIDIPQILPIAKPDFIMAAGMCLKAGVSAEVIGLARLTVGEQLYYSKLYIDTAGLFAWSIIVVVLALLWQKVFRMIVEFAERALKKI
jgi:NitT/TauT family transport system permease protein